MLRAVSKATRRLGESVVDEVGDLPAFRDPTVRRYFSSRANWFFLISAAIMYSIAWPTLPLTHNLPDYALPVVAAFATWPLALAISAPVVGWAISAVSAQLIGLVLSTHSDWPWSIQVTHIIVLLVLTFFAFLRSPLRWVPGVWFATCVVFWVGAPGSDGVGWAFGLTSLAILVVVSRALLAARRQVDVSAQETKMAESEAAVLQERARIARDLHDVVAHRMSMVVVMAQTARYRLADVSDEAGEEFDAIAGAARTSLDEVRQLLGVLRVEEGHVVAPNPGLADIAPLVIETRRAGSQVTLHDTLERDGMHHVAVSETSALVVYRIVQESLANATRHAPGAHIDIHLAPTAALDAVELVVVNGKATAPSLGLAGAGTGIRGMIERARTVGGTLTAAPTADGGFAVRAWIPSVVSAGALTTPLPTPSTDG